MRIPVALLVVSFAASVAACASGAGEKVEVVSTNRACTPEKTTVPNGKVSFEVRNEGSDVTELYVKTARDKILGEVEDVGPGTSRILRVDLDAGAYKLVCKPGQKGAGITTPITVR